MKKLATVVLSCLLMFCLVACSSGGSGSTSSADTSSSSVSSASDETSATTEESSTDLGNVLVVYYSATGNTERVANSIAEATGGDLFEIEPTEPYTDDDLNWNDESSRVSREYEDESLRDVPLVNTTVDGWDDYDTVFIGYPIWWGIAAWPVDGFVEANDFSDKTVIPFATSASSGMGQSGELLADLAGTGDWQDGMRFSSGAGDDEVQEWVETLA
ncbi:MAG: flavodoxin [Peptococcaceae bacterium]|nr:flavodoxin [Peptococcaceae bacterium]